MNAIKIEKEQETQSTVKKPYNRPVLVVYGKLVELTAAGSGHSNEAHANQTSNAYKPG